jgi:hypothetical protein
MINKSALTDRQRSEAESVRGITLDLGATPRANELLTALGFTPEISVDGYGELMEVRFRNPTDVNVGTVLDSNIYAVGLGEGRAELWVDEQDYIKSFECHNVDVRYAHGTLTIGDIPETVENDLEDGSSTPSE